MKRRFYSRGDLAGLSGRVTLIAFVLFVLLGGSNAVAIRFSNHELPPFWGATIRFASAALIFWALSWSGASPCPQAGPCSGPCSTVLSPLGRATRSPTGALCASRRAEQQSFWRLFR